MRRQLAEAAVWTIVCAVLAAVVNGSVWWLFVAPVVAPVFYLEVRSLTKERSR